MGQRALRRVPVSPELIVERSPDRLVVQLLEGAPGDLAACTEDEMVEGTDAVIQAGDLRLVTEIRNLAGGAGADFLHCGGKALARASDDHHVRAAAGGENGGRKAHAVGAAEDNDLLSVHSLSPQRRTMEKAKSPPRPKR